jgi:hypothetical protein
MEQFIELVDAVHRRNARIFLDIAINHTGGRQPARELIRVARARSRGPHQVPGAWGVQWEDLQTRLPASRALAVHGRGVPHLVPARGGRLPLRRWLHVPHDAWKYIVAQVREQFLDTTFLLEGWAAKPPLRGSC